MKRITLLSVIVIIISGFNCSKELATQSDPQPDSRLLFYNLDREIYTITNNQDQPEYIFNGAYPIWLDSKSQIGFHSPFNNDYYVYDIDKDDTVRTYDITKHGGFSNGRFSEYLNKFLFSFELDGQPSIILMDLSGNIETISLDYPIKNPVCSGVDDWIYFLNFIDGTGDVSRMKSDGSEIEHFTSSADFIYSNFSVSHDGNFIAVPKWNESYHSIAIIDTRTKQERSIDLTNLNLVGYTSFSKDNKYIYFTGGDNRDLYRINFDGSNLQQYTDSSSEYYYRPLSW
jgi:hypothetical protein